MDPSFDLPDPTDWLPTRLPSFEPLEASLRCEVCKEFYNDPVITSCAHTFCSLCIRRCLTADSKCPTCRAPNSSDKLMVNLVVREIVKKFQEARPKALELARRKDGDKPRKEAGARKRKLDDTDIEEGESVRQSRARLTRSRKGVDGWQSTPIEIVDTDDEDSQEFIPEDVPEGMVKCPICQTPMKEEQVFPHLNDCPDAPADQKAGSVRNTRSKSNTATLNPLQRRQRDLSPAQTRLPQLNYHLLKEGGLRKKLQELGIPSGGKKELLAQRHTEWLHLWNSNCDSDAPRSKRELLQDLAVWERTRGAITSAAESKFMRKDFDVQRHATMHKSQFDDLIANARRKRDALKEVDKKEEIRSNETHHDTEEQAKPQPTTELPRPYEGNEKALATIREKVELTSRDGSTVLVSSQEAPSGSRHSATPAQAGSREGSEATPGPLNPFESPNRKKPMFSLPEEPVVDVENSTAIQ